MKRWIDLIKQCFVPVDDIRDYNDVINELRSTRAMQAMAESEVTRFMAECDVLKDWQAATIDRLHEIDRLIATRKYKAARAVIIRSMPGNAIDEASDNLAKTLRPDPEYRERRMAQFDSARRKRIADNLRKAGL